MSAPVPAFVNGAFRECAPGSREQGPAARELYTELRTVQVTP